MTTKQTKEMQLKQETIKNAPIEETTISKTPTKGTPVEGASIQETATTESLVNASSPQGTEHAVVRNYKDSLFRMIFSDPSELLALYNALNGSHYTDTSKLEIKTLENAIYMNIKNDISFLIDTRLYLYEHQSTYSPNIPLRNLLYVADQLQELVNSEDLYQSIPVKIPSPEFVVFYNGTTMRPEQEESRLSKLYATQTGIPKLELIVTTININLGHNKDLMEKCKTLRDYAAYVDKVRTYTKTMNLPQAVQKAVDECIHDNILREFLLRQKAEAMKVSIYEFDQAKHDKALRKEGEITGEIKGKAESLLLFLSQYGSIPENMNTAIMKENDITRLDEMLRKALQLQSIEKFAKEFELIEHNNYHA